MVPFAFNPYSAEEEKTKRVSRAKGRSSFCRPGEREEESGRVSWPVRERQISDGSSWGIALGSFLSDFLHPKILCFANSS